MAPTGPIQIRLSALATPSLDVNGADCGLPSGCLLVQVRFVAGVGQTLLANGDLLLTFDSTNWATPQTVTVVAIDDAVVDGSDLQSFADSARRPPPRRSSSPSTAICRSSCRGSPQVTR